MCVLCVQARRDLRSGRADMCVWRAVLKTRGYLNLQPLEEVVTCDGRKMSMYNVKNKVCAHALVGLIAPTPATRYRLGGV